MKEMFSNLFSPIKINSVILKNRIIASPSSQGDINHDGTLNEHNIAYYARKAQGGAAMVVIGDGIVHPTGQDHPYQVYLYSDDCLPSITRAAEEIHKYGCLCSYELSHGGIVCNPEFINGEAPYGPSAIPLSIGFQTKESISITSQEMTVEFMEEIADSYARAAARCKLAGFDMVMVHAAHGWLIGQFFSPLINKRIDEYGGSLENRCRFAIMVLKKVREAVGPRFPIDFRINGIDGAEGGLTLEESVQICKILEPYVDAFHVSATLHMFPELQDLMQSPIFTKRGHLLDLAAAIKKEVSVPVTTVGGFSDPVMMEEAIAQGKADLVALGRQMLADPDLPNKAHDGTPELIVPCQRCATCQSGRFTRQTARCAVNPEIGREYELQFMVPKAYEKKKVLIAGGGPAGMEAAIVAASRGHDVTLYEKSDRFGGALNFAEYVPFKEDLFRLVKVLEAKISRLPIKVIMNTALTPEIAAEEKADVILSAIGADMILPPFPGSNGDNVYMPDVADKLADRLPGSSVAVIGGGLVGIESAIHQAMLGKQVTIIEALPEIARDANIRYSRTYNLKLKELGIKVLVNTKCAEIDKEGVKCIGTDGNEIFVSADAVIVAIGMRSREAESEALRNCAHTFRAIGNCQKVGVVADSMRAGFDAGMFI